MNKSSFIESVKSQIKRFNEMVEVLGEEQVNHFVNDSKILSIYPIVFCESSKKFKINKPKVENCFKNAKKNGLYSIQMIV